MLDKVEYLFYNYQVTWEEARLICLGYESHLATLDTMEKAMFIIQRTSESSLADEEYWIGSKKHSRGQWIWIMNNEKLMPNQLIREMIVIPHYADRSVELDLYCLTMFRKNHNIPMFIPLRCHEQRPFICQRDKLPFGINIEAVFSIKVENRNFTLYSAKLTWLESVIQCRQQGLQIAEVLTSNEAQLLAMKMIRVRPRAIENAWIGGHMKDGLWKWLPTGSNISRNEMWDDESMISGDCLLFDRHYCKFPIYLSVKCDRKRNFICQTPLAKAPIIEPIAVAVDTCRYWIGFHPLKWFEASQSCKKLNATLVALDSVTTIKHVTNIMIDNRGQLQHIWMDGKRQHNQSEKLKDGVNNNNNTWIWESSRKPIPNLGESFIPWCEDSRLYGNDADCLNMDREDFDVPIVYGLSCKHEQSYICQEWTLSCDKIKKLDIKPSLVNTNDTYTNTEKPMENLLSNSSGNMSKNNTYNNSNYEPYSEHDTTISTVPSKIFTFDSDKLESKSVPNNKSMNEKFDNTSKTTYFNPKDKDLNSTKIPIVRSQIQSPAINFIKQNNRIRPTFNEFTDSDVGISVRLLNDDLNNRKKVSNVNGSDNLENMISIKPEKKKYKTNVEQLSDAPILSFRDIIELMVKDITENKSLPNVIISNDGKLPNTSKGNASTNINGKYLDKANNRTDNIPLLVKENISNIVQSSINKNIHNFSSTTHTAIKTSTAKTYNKDKPYKNNSRINKLDKNLRTYQPFKLSDIRLKNHALEKSIASQYKVIDSSEINVNDTNMFSVGQIMKNIFHHSKQNLSIGDEHNRLVDVTNSNKLIKTTPKYDTSHGSYLITKRKNIINHRKKTSSGNTIQSIHENKSKDKTIMQFRDVVDAFKTNFNDEFAQKSWSLAVINEMPSKIDRNHIKPWNALLKRVFQSLNNTKINFSNKKAKLKVKDFTLDIE